MKSLRRITFINWYLFEAEEWRVKGNVALLGKNGSGKSSFIDAMQLVLLGGNLHDWTPNAKASDRNFKRDVRSYALGLVKDEQAISDSDHYQPRDDALTRVVLVFHDDETDECTSIGACVSARRSDAKAQTEAFFILHGHELRLADFLDSNDLGDTPKSYQALKAMFYEKDKNSEKSDGEPNLYLFTDNSKLYVEQMLRVLGPKQRPPMTNKFRRAFKQSIKLSGLQGSVSDFVKTSILDDDAIKLDIMRKSIASYNSKKEAILRINKQISMLDKTYSQFKQAHTSSMKRAGYLWCKAELTFSANDIQTIELRETLLELRTRYSKAKLALENSRKQLKYTRDELDQITLTIRSDKVESAKERLEERLGVKQSDIRRSDDGVSEIRIALSYATELVRHRNVLGTQYFSEVDNLVALADYGDHTWPLDPSGIDQAIKIVLEKFPTITDQINENRDNVVYNIRLNEEEIESTINKLARLNKGFSSVHDSTQNLIDLLATEGIKATPVCELVEVNDSYWQAAIEAFLRVNTEALIVEQKDCSKAIKIYRALRKDGQIGAIIIDTDKVSRWKDSSPEQGTASALIEGSDNIAVSYLRRLLNGIELHDDTNKIRQSKRALGPDGSYQRAGGFKRLHLADYRKLGKGAAKSQIDFLQGSLSTLSETLSALNTKERLLKEALSALSNLHIRLSNKPLLATLMETLTQDKQEALRIRSQIDAIDTSHLESLREQQATLNARVITYEKEKDAALSTRTSARDGFKIKNAQRREKIIAINVLSQARTIAAEDNDYDAELTDGLLDEIDNSFDLDNYESYKPAINHADERALHYQREQTNKELKCRDLFTEYTTKFPNDISNIQLNGNHSLRIEIDHRLHEIKNVGLHEREKQVSEALHNLHRVIRSDLSIKLRGNIEKMKARFRELNKELYDRPFSSNQRYDFRYSKMSEFKDFLDFVEKVDNDTVADFDGLFDEHSYINEIIERILDDEESDILGDYRNYYTFDIGIKDPETNIEELLSRKMPSASGGEHRTPFYVAMGAALAGAYRLQRRDDDKIDGGMSLYFADEAFEKMDYVNTTQAAKYLKSIGLQLFVAAPDDAEHKIRSFVDTVLFFIRDGQKAVIHVDYVTTNAQNMISETFNSDALPLDKGISHAR